MGVNTALAVHKEGDLLRGKAAAETTQPVESRAQIVLGAQTARACGYDTGSSILAESCGPCSSLSDTAATGLADSRPTFESTFSMISATLGFVRIMAFSNSTPVTLAIAFRSSTTDKESRPSASKFASSTTKAGSANSRKHWKIAALGASASSIGVSILVGCTT